MQHKANSLWQPTSNLFSSCRFLIQLNGMLSVQLLSSPKKRDLTPLQSVGFADDFQPIRDSPHVSHLPCEWAGSTLAILFSPLQPSSLSTDVCNRGIGWWSTCLVHRWPRHSCEDAWWEWGLEIAWDRKGSSISPKSATQWRLQAASCF